MRLGRNEPCHCGSGKKYKVCHLESDAEARRAEAEHGAAHADAPGPELPDPRVFERSTADVVRMFEARSRRPRRAAEAAQELMYRAWEQRSPAGRIALAREALSVHEGCADAYSLLASEEARTDEEARELWERAVKAAAAALGKRAFVEDVGHFWGLLETRPYMRARHGLAQCLWHLGDRAGAIAHFEELLRLNPNDNQGVRYQFAACLQLVPHLHGSVVRLRRPVRVRPAIAAPPVASRLARSRFDPMNTGLEMTRAGTSLVKLGVTVKCGAKVLDVDRDG